MHFNKVLIALQALLLIFITSCLETALTASSRHQKGRSASLRIFPVHQRQIEGHGRAALDLGSEYDKEQPVLKDSAEEGRGLMKKFLLFKSLFTQQKSEPSSNVIIITQPAAAPTTTIPTTTGTTTTMASKADTPTVVGGNTGRGTQAQAQNEQDDEDVFGTLENSKPEDIVQQLIKQTKPNKMRIKKLNGQLTKTQKQQQRQWQRQSQQQRQQHLQRNKRKRLAIRVPQTKPQRNRQQENQMPLPLLNTINLSQQPNQKSSNNNNNNNNNNNYNKHNGSSNNNNNSNTNHNNNIASGILNLNTNMRLQNIMNAFRKQTPIVYNY